MCHYIDISRSGYYKHQHHKSSQAPSKLRKQQILEHIKRIWDRSKHIYGAGKITQILRRMKYRISERTVGKYMRELGIKAYYVGKWVTTTRNSKYSDDLKNILNEQFNPARPNAVWCIDTTYIPLKESFAYLTSIMDLYSRKIIGWELADTLEVSSVIPLINRVKKQRNITQPLIIHSDRGSQFTSESYCKATIGMTLSYSKKAFPWDNACIESFHALIKREWLNHFKISTFAEAKRLVFEYINAFYNTVRIHSHCGYLSPNEFEDEYYQIQRLSSNFVA